MSVILVSACLLGCPTRYDGRSVPCEAVLALAKDNTLVPVCPEQLGGLPTPRLPSERQANGRVLRCDGEDVSENYRRGAELALRIAELSHAELCILKSGSPSCGKGVIYDGSFSGKKIPGSGITAEMLSAAGYKVFTEKDI